MTEPYTTNPSLLDVADLCRMFEEAEDASLTARKDAERDRDYVDGKQLTADELAELRKRGQPPVIDNRIKTKIDYLVGLEKQQRVKPKAFPRTPRHEEDADAATEALRYVAESEDYEAKRSAVWRNMLVEGAGGIRVYAEPSRYAPPLDPMSSSALTQAEYDIRLQRIAWDRLFFDPHSAEPDFSDAGYLGIVVWMDFDDALAMYPDAQGHPRRRRWRPRRPTPTTTSRNSRTGPTRSASACASARSGSSATSEWHFAEFTKGGILKAGPSPYVTDKGESDCELMLQSAYVDRENDRYGVVREMISPQDEINKRRSKSLHLLNTAQVIYEEGAVADIEAFRKRRCGPTARWRSRPARSTTGRSNSAPATISPPPSSSCCRRPRARST